MPDIEYYYPEDGYWEDDSDDDEDEDYYDPIVIVIEWSLVWPKESAEDSNETDDPFDNPDWLQSQAEGIWSTSPHADIVCLHAYMYAMLVIADQILPVVLAGRYFLKGHYEL